MQLNSLSLQFNTINIINIRSCKFHDGGSLHERSWSCTSARGELHERSWRAARALMESCTSARGVGKRRSGAFKQKKNYQNRTIIKEVTSKNVILHDQFAHSSLHIAVELHERSWSAMCKLLCANCYVQTAMCKLLCANCYVQTAMCKLVWYVQTGMCKLLCANWYVQIAMCKLLCANCYVQTGMCKRVCANWYVQTAMCKLLCANWLCKLVRAK